MTASGIDFDALVARLGELFPGGPPPRRELLCGPGVIMWLRILTPHDEPEFPWSQTPPFTGIPLARSPDLGRGEWELTENGETVARGRFELPEPPDFASISAPVSFARPPSWLPPLAFRSPVPLVAITGV